MASIGQQDFRASQRAALLARLLIHVKAPDVSEGRLWCGRADLQAQGALRPRRRGGVDAAGRFQKLDFTHAVSSRLPATLYSPARRVVCAAPSSTPPRSNNEQRPVNHFHAPVRLSYSVPRAALIAAFPPKTTKPLGLGTPKSLIHIGLIAGFRWKPRRGPNSANLSSSC